MYIIRKQIETRANTLGVLDTHQVSGALGGNGSRDNDNSVTSVGRSFLQESSNGTLNGGLHVGHVTNDLGGASAKETAALTGDTFRRRQDVNGTTGSELGDLRSRGSTLAADNQGLGTDINGRLNGGRSDRLRSGERSVTGQGTVTDSLVEHVSVLGVFGLAASVAHDTDGSGGVFTVSSLSGKHDGIGSIQDGVGDITALGTSRTRVGNHTLQHLSGGDNRLATVKGERDKRQSGTWCESCSMAMEWFARTPCRVNNSNLRNVGLADHHFLSQKDFFRRDFHAQIATRHHNGVGSLEDLFVVLHALLVLNLADNLDSLALFAKNFSNLVDIRSLADKGGGNKINVIGNTPVDDIIDILFRQCWQVHHHSWQVHVFALANGAIIFDTARDFTSGNVRGNDHEDQTSVGTQNLLTRVDGLGQGRVRASELAAVALEGVIGSQDNGFALDEFNLLGAVGKETGADFGALGVQHDGCRVVREKGKKKKKG